MYHHHGYTEKFMISHGPISTKTYHIHVDKANVWLKHPPQTVLRVILWWQYFLCVAYGKMKINWELHSCKNSRNYGGKMRVGRSWDNNDELLIALGVG